MDSDKMRWEKVKEIRAFQSMELGPYITNEIYNDVKHLGFSLSRYKFASKLLMYRHKISVCELGCQEAMGGILLKQCVDLDRYVGVDLDKEAISWNKQCSFFDPEIFEFVKKDFFDFTIDADRRFDSVISMDVIEHIEPRREDEFCGVIANLLKDNGMAVIGTPSVNMSPYASKPSQIGHINVYDQKRLYSLLEKYFNNVFIFGMNDEIVHMSFEPLTCYIIAVCAGRRNNK